MILLIYSILIILLALTDVLFNKHHKPASKIIEEISFALVLFSLLLFKKYTIDYIISVYIMYIMIRMSLFDFFFNVFSNIPYDYSGSTTILWDKLMSYFKNWKFWVLRGFFYVLAVFVWYEKLR